MNVFGLTWRGVSAALALGTALLGVSTVAHVGRGEVGHHVENPAAESAGSKAWFKQVYRDEAGRIPSDGLAKANAQRRAMIAFQKQYRTAKPTLPQKWRAIGPNNLSGRINAIAVDPSDVNHILAGGPSTGLWQSHDKGASWTLVSDAWQSLSIGAIAFAPLDKKIIYVGTGGSDSGGLKENTTGLYKSTDGGATFNQLPSTANFDGVRRIAVSWVDSNKVSICTGFFNPGEQQGAYRSTDGGTTWTQSINSTDVGDIQYVGSGAFNTSRMVATRFNASDNSRRPVWSADDGATWTDSTGFVNFGTYPSIARGFPGSGKVYFLQYTQSDGSAGSCVYKSTNNGQSYTLLSNSTQTFSPQNSGFVFWVDPFNESNMVTGDTTMWRSSDGGATWINVSNDGPNTNDPHADIHTLVQDPGDSTRLFVGTDGGAFYTDNIATAGISTGWTRCDQGIQTIQFYGVDGANDTGVVAGGTQDNGSMRVAVNDPHAVIMLSGDGGYTRIDDTDSNYIYSQYVTGILRRSTDGGASMQDLPNTPESTTAAAPWMTPLAVELNDGNRLFCVMSSVYRSDNIRSATPTWNSIRPALSGTQGSAIAVDNNYQQTLYAGYMDGQIWYTVDSWSASPSWFAIDDNSSTNPLPNRAVMQLVVDRNNYQVLYACLGGFSSNNLWKTTDRGATWTSISGSGPTALPAAPVHTMTTDPKYPNHLFCGTEVGAFESNDGGATWSTSDFGPSNAPVFDMRFLHGSKTKLLVGTYGRGAWIYDLTLPVSISVSPNQMPAGNNANVTMTIDDPAPKGGEPMTLILRDGFGSEGSIPVPMPDGQSSVTVSVFFPGAVSSNLHNTLTLKVNGVESSPADLTFVPPTAASFSLSSTSVFGGTSITGTVILNGPAPTGGIQIPLSTNSAAASAPGAITVPQGATFATFPVSTKGVDSDSIVKIYSPGTTAFKNLTVKAATPLKFQFNPVTVPGGVRSIGTITLNGLAGPSGRTFTLASGSPSVTMPATATVAAQTSSIAVQASTVPVSTKLTLTPTAATPGMATLSSNLIVRPPVISSFALSKSSQTGGNINGISIVLDAKAPTGGANVLIGGAAAAHLPASLMVPAGQTSVAATFTPSGVDSTVSTTVTADYGTSHKTFPLTILPANLISVSFNPTAVNGGSNSTATLKFDGLTGPSGRTVTNTSSIAALGVPASVAVGPGLRQAQFTATSSGVDANQTATVRSTGPQVRTATVSVLRGTALSATPTPSSVKGGGKVTIVIRLTGKAGPSGTKFNLSSTGTHSPVPASITVPAGALTVAFVINTLPLPLPPGAGPLPEPVTVTCAGPSGVGTVTANYTITP